VEYKQVRLTLSVEKFRELELLQHRFDCMTYSRTVGRLIDEALRGIYSLPYADETATISTINTQTQSPSGTSSL
jgi:hypothetical protein